MFRLRIAKGPLVLFAIPTTGCSFQEPRNDGDPDAGREPFYVMELCDGGSLADRIVSSGRLRAGEVVPLILAVAAADNAGAVFGPLLAFFILRLHGVGALDTSGHLLPRDEHAMRNVFWLSAIPAAIAVVILIINLIGGRRTL